MPTLHSTPTFAFVSCSSYISGSAVWERQFWVVLTALSLLGLWDTFGDDLHPYWVNMNLAGMVSQLADGFQFFHHMFPSSFTVRGGMFCKWAPGFRPELFGSQFLVAKAWLATAWLNQGCPPRDGSASAQRLVAYPDQPLFWREPIKRWNPRCAPKILDGTDRICIPWCSITFPWRGLFWGSMTYFMSGVAITQQDQKRLPGWLPSWGDLAVE